MAKGNHSFTEQDIRKRFGAIVGHTVAEVDTAGVLTASAASRNKGRIGAVIEQSVLGYPADSDRRPDIVIDGQPWEVKATGLKESARGGWRAKEPMSITAVAPEGIVTESFSTSAFWHKAERLLVVYYLYVRPGRGVAVEYAGFEFKGYDLHTWREVDRCRLDGRGIRPSGTAASCPTALDATGRPIVHRVADQVELVPDGTGDAGPREYNHQTDDGDDQYVLDNRLPFRAAGKSGRYPHRKEFPLRSCAAPFARVCRCGSRVGLLRKFATVLPQRQGVFTRTGPHPYRTTLLHPYRATRKASSRHLVQQKGALNGTPQDS